MCKWMCACCFLYRGNSSRAAGFARKLVVLSCASKECSKRQDNTLPLPFPRDDTKSQLWNEKCFIHCLRMIAIALDNGYQSEVEQMVQSCKGEFKKTAIKGFGRMKNKCISKDDHYHAEYPRCSACFLTLEFAQSSHLPYGYCCCY